jgi:hypothetical protein
MWLLTGSALLLLLSQYSYITVLFLGKFFICRVLVFLSWVVILLCVINICHLRRQGSADTVKKVKEQTFQKLSTKVPISNRNETKTFEFVHEFVLSKQGADSGPKRNNLFSMRQIRGQYQNVLVSFPKRYRNICPFVFDADWESNSGLTDRQAR